MAGPMAAHSPAGSAPSPAMASTAAVTRWGTPGLDVAAGVVAQLRRAGVRRIDRPGWCTYEDRRFYSHRRDGTTGRIFGAALAAPADGVGQ